MVSIKVYFNDEIRRFQFDAPKSGPIFAQLVQKLSSMVPLNLQEISLCWKDREGDIVVFSTDDELKEALRNQEGDTFKIHLIRKDQKAPLTESSFGQQHQQPSGEIHVSVTCDGCDGPVAGKRYKCLMCGDYDLCSMCEEKNVHNQHPMIRIATPNDDSWKQVLWRRGGCGRGFGRRGCRAGPQMPPGAFPQGGNWRQWMRDWQQQWRTQAGAPGQQQEQDGDVNANSQAPPTFTGAEYLRQVGDCIADVLSGFGIDVDVDVDERPKAPQTADQGSMQSQPEQAPVVPQAPLASQEGNPIDTDNDPVGTEPMTPTRSLTPPESNTPEEQQHDWTFVQRSDLFVPAQQPAAPVVVNYTPAAPAPVVVNVPTAASPRLYPDPYSQPITQTPLVNATAPVYPAQQAATTPAYPVQQAVTTPAYPAQQAAVDPFASTGPASLRQSAWVEHPNPKVAIALNQMMAMGFTNEGGWLAQLLEAKDGNISAVLDTMQPRQR